jgi:hypothetical protein
VDLTVCSSPSSSLQQQQQQHHGAHRAAADASWTVAAHVHASPLQSDLREYLYKVLVVGDIGVGKTSIIKRYVHNVYSTHYKATVSAASGSRSVQLLTLDANHRLAWILPSR